MSKSHDLLIEEIELMLGGGMVDVDLDPKHYSFAIRSAIERYRYRSQNATEECFVIIKIQPYQDTYFLPENIAIVRSCYRSGNGITTGIATSDMDPLQLAYYQNIFQPQNPSGSMGTGSGSLATYDLSAQHQELLARLFRRELIFTFESSSHRIQFHRTFTEPEDLLLRIYRLKDEEVLLRDIYAKTWIRDYAIAKCKMMLGEARSKFQQLAGPSGGVSLNGEALKTEAKEEFERLEAEVMTQIDQREGYGFTIG